MPDKINDISIVLCGEAGQGIKTIEHILTHVLHEHGYYVFSTKEYMSLIRGGSNSNEIRVSTNEISGFVDKVHLVIPFYPGAIDRLTHRLDKETVIIGKQSDFDDKYKVVDVSIDEMVEPFGKLYTNVLAAGLILPMYNIPFEELENFIVKQFEGKEESVIQKNKDAAKAGFDKGEELIENGKIKYQMDKLDNKEKLMLVKGAEAVGMGALAGGCNFVASYPMSPSTAVLVFMAQQSRDFTLVVEQAEDEIAAGNMMLGSWYAGGRAMITTSGGGFDLMAESLSMAAMAESPAIYHIAQRVGPATGLPTRTEQGDLNLVLYGGHGEFPRVIYAPGNPTEAFELSAKAFQIADEFQIPVFILTDQYFMDSYFTVSPFEIDKLDHFEHKWVEPDNNYQRYKYTDNGISPRGIPGTGKGFVCVDSDEHFEDGHITEDWNTRIKMQDKRMRRLNELTRQALKPTITGKQDAPILIMGWGSTHQIIKEAVERIDREDVAYLHFGQVYPLNPEVKTLVQKAEKRIVIENNFTGQFAELIHSQWDIKCEENILKYDGFPFSVEELVKKINNII